MTGFDCNCFVGNWPFHKVRRNSFEEIKKLSNGRINLAAGTLYGAINTLLEKGWIEAQPEIKDSRKKEYIITAEGLEVLKAELARLSELLTNGKNILGV